MAETAEKFLRLWGIAVQKQLDEYHNWQDAGQSGQAGISFFEWKNKC